MNGLLGKLRQKGHRLTRQRHNILNSLTPYPQSVVEIMDILSKKGMTVDKATIYRTLDYCLGLGIVNKVKFKDKTDKYELLSDSHHHHLVCDNCGLIKDIALDENKLLERIGEQTNFQVKSHTFEFFGLCSQCQQL